MKIKIKKKTFFDSKNRPLLIAEISANHCGNKKSFLNHIIKAKQAGADLIKIQTYEPDDITIKSSEKNFKIKEGLWRGKKLWDLYYEAKTPYAWHQDAFNLAKKIGAILFSTPFSIRALKFLEKFNPPLYKIASFEITDLKIIYEIAKTRKPIIMSTGMANVYEIKKAIKLINKFHNKIVLLYCVSGYPTPEGESNIKTINTFKKFFKNNLIGLSDHTNSISSSLAAIPLGVVAIEKHFKVSSKTNSHDKDFSLNQSLFKKLSNYTKSIHNNLGDDKIRLKASEKKSLMLRRSIFATREIKKNEKFSKMNIETFRPKIGMGAENYFKIIGKRSKKKISKYEAIYKKSVRF